MGAISDWRSFWDNAHSIYVNDRHKDVHYRDIADAIAGFVPGPRTRVLDFGCGEALHADRVAAVAAEVLLCDSAPSVRAAMAARFAGNPRIKVDCARGGGDELPDRSLDLIVANSVVQYLTAAELERLLALWRRLLAPDGTLIVADVIPPDVGAASDVTALLRYAARHGFLVAALLGARPHGGLALSQIAQPTRDCAIHRSRVRGKARGSGLHRRTARAQHGAQSGAHQFPCAQEMIPNRLISSLSFRIATRPRACPRWDLKCSSRQKPTWMAASRGIHNHSRGKWRCSCQFYRLGLWMPGSLASLGPGMTD